MQAYIKELEKQNEELRQKLASAELIQDIVRFVDTLKLDFKVSQEAVDDLRGMFGVDMEAAIKQYAAEEFDKRFKERFVKL
jgi:hypothetical protein